MSAEELKLKVEALAAKLDADVHRLWAEFEEYVAKELEKAEGKDEAAADTKTDAPTEQPPAGQTSTGASVAEGNAEEAQAGQTSTGSTDSASNTTGATVTEASTQGTSSSEASQPGAAAADTGAATGTETGTSTGASTETAVTGAAS